MSNKKSPDIWAFVRDICRFYYGANYQRREFNHQVAVTRGVLQAECSSLLSSFFRELREIKKAAEKTEKAAKEPQETVDGTESLNYNN